MANPRTEADTREQIVESNLAAAGWSDKQRNVIEEFFLGVGMRVSEEPDTSELGRKFVDYVLREADGKPLAVVEAKRGSMLGLSRLPIREQKIRDAFDDFIGVHPHFGSQQVHFLSAVRAAVLRRATLTGEDLVQLPFSRIGEARKLFSGAELTEILDLASRLAA